MGQSQGWILGELCVDDSVWCNMLGVLAVSAVLVLDGTKAPVSTLRVIEAPGAESLTSDGNSGTFFALRHLDGRRDLYLYDSRGSAARWGVGPVSSRLIGSAVDGTPVAFYSAGSVAFGPRQKRLPFPAVKDGGQHLQFGVLIGATGGNSVVLRWTESRGPEWTRSRERTLTLDANPGRAIGDVAVSPTRHGVAAVALGGDPSLQLFPLEGGRPPLRELALRWRDGGEMESPTTLTLLNDTTAVALFPKEGKKLRLGAISLRNGEVVPLGEFLVPETGKPLAVLDGKGTFALLTYEPSEGGPKPFVVPQTRRFIRVMRVSGTSSK